MVVTFLVYIASASYVHIPFMYHAVYPCNALYVYCVSIHTAVPDCLADTISQPKSQNMHGLSIDSNVAI